MQTDEAKVRIINNTYSAGPEERTARFLTAQGMQMVEYGMPTGWAGHTQLILYFPKLYAFQYLAELFGAGSPQIILQTDPTSNVDIEIRIGEDWIGTFPEGY
jgi:hypothetical protein